MNLELDNLDGDLEDDNLEGDIRPAREYSSYYNLEETSYYLVEDLAYMPFRGV